MITLTPNRPNIKPQRQSFGMKYEVYVDKKVPHDFATRIEDSLRVLPDRWGVSLRKANYRIHCAESVKSFFASLGFKTNNVPDAEAITHGSPGKVIVFTPKIAPEDTQRIVNHEISHGIVNSEGILSIFDWNAIRQDTQKRKNQRIDSKNNPYDLTKFLRRNLSEYQRHEILADIFAWHQPGGGLWGSGHKGSLKDPDFLKKNFPSTYEAVGKYEVANPKGKSDSFSKVWSDEIQDDDEIPF